ncbi:MAG: hypothetical protein JWL63_1805, partial [Rhodocyclales bacterium]|nr:hypothetical protein [Rhodocyclales bacterium]
MPNAMIEVDNLNRSVDGKAILRGVSLTLDTGCTLGLIGRTGAGKTTL